MGLKKKKLTDLLTEGDDSISLMSYLKSTFPNEWNNFKERMKTQVPDIDVKELSELDFAPSELLLHPMLHPHGSPRTRNGCA